MLKRNTTIFYKTIICAIVAFSYMHNLSAETFSSTGFYIATGKTTMSVNEIVYSQSSSRADGKISHLTWKTQNAPATIFGLRQRIASFLTVNFEGRRLSKSNKSVMDDYDWAYTSTTDWTDWSHHDNTLLTQAEAYNLNIAITLYGNTGSYFSLITGYKQETIEWKSYGGTYIYSTNSFRDSSGSFAEGSSAIDYKQEYTTPYYGLKLGALFGNWLYTFQALTSDNVNLDATDIHHARNLVFTDDFEPGKMHAYQFGVAYLVNDNFAVNFNYDLQNYKEVRGGTVYTSSVTGNKTGSCTNCAGSDNTSSTASIGISLSF